MKRILFLSTAKLSHRSGGALATLAYYNAICSIFPGQVDLVMPEEFCIGDYKNAIKAPKRSMLSALLSGSMHRYKAVIKKYLKCNKGKYELCFLNGGIYSGDMMDDIHSHGCKIIVLHHNFEREYQMDSKTTFTLGGRTSFFVNRNEKRAYQKADCNLFLSQEDKTLFETHYGLTNKPAVVTGSFEPVHEILPQYENVTQNIIAITGSMNTNQTMCGIVDFTNNYYKDFREICPNWTLLIAGRNPREEVYKLKEMNPDSISVIPNPEDMNAVLNGVSIFLCPTNVGGGLKLRVMDGLKAGLPILVHKISSRGYNYYLDKPYFKVYNDNQSFRKGLNALMDYCEKDFDRKTIQSDYKHYFGFEMGCNRLKHALDLMK